MNNTNALKQKNTEQHVSLFVQSAKTAHSCLRYQVTQEQLYLNRCHQEIDRDAVLDCRIRDYQQALAIIFIQIASSCNPSYRNGGRAVCAAKKEIKNARNKIYARDRYPDFPLPDDTLRYARSISTIVQAYRSRRDMPYQKQLWADFFSLRSGWNQESPMPLHKKGKHMVVADAYQLVAAGYVVKADKHFDCLPHDMQRPVLGQRGIRTINQCRNDIMHVNADTKINDLDRYNPSFLSAADYMQHYAKENLDMRRYDHY